MIEETGIFLVSADGHIFGKPNKARLKALPWYKKLWAKINKRYKRRYIDIEPLEIESYEDRTKGGIPLRNTNTNLIPPKSVWIKQGPRWMNWLNIVVWVLGIGFIIYVLIKFNN